MPTSDDLGLNAARHQPIPARLVRSLGEGVGTQPQLLSFAEAKAAGEAMYERWDLMLEAEDPPLLREDAGWADLARVGWEAVWAMRRAALNEGNDNGEEAGT